MPTRRCSRREDQRFIRSAVRLYLKAKERREIETRLAHAYSGKADAVLEEVDELMSRQSWPAS